MSESTRGDMSVREAGRKGGEIVKKKYGPQFYEEIGKIGGKKGGETVKQRYGPGFYKEIGQKGGQRVKQLIEEAKALEKKK